MAKVFLSIGAGPGIGLATAKRFAREGYAIVLSARNPERLRPCAAQIEAMGVKVEVRQVDAADARSVAALVDSIGPDLSVLHYNASVLHYAKAKLLCRTIDDESVDSIASDLQINVASALAAIKASLRALRASGSGTVLVTGGGLAFEPSGDFLMLSVSKAALRATVQALFEPLKAQGVHVATVIVCRAVAPESADVAAIADEFWTMHAQPQKDWTFEAIYGNESGLLHN